MSWAELPVKLKAYIIFLACTASPISIWAAHDLFTNTYNTNWLILFCLTLFTIPFFLFFRSANATLFIGDAFIMAIAMMYGAAPCLAATFCNTLLISIFAPRPKVYAYRIVFNTSSTILVAWLYSSAFELVRHGSDQTPDIILAAATLAVTYFFANSVLTSVAISWSIKESVIRFWAKTCIPMALDFSFSATIATAMALLKNSSGPFAPLAAAPLVVIVWGYIRLNQVKMTEAEKHLSEQEQLYLRTVESLALAVDAKDQTTYGHIRRVRAYATGLARLCGIKDPDELKAIETGSLLHDIGKIAIEDYILNKPGRLSKQEFEKIKVHAAAGDEILQQVQFPFPVAKYVRSHHERWDGLGYPDGLKGEDIPLGARILAVADAFDAIRFSRPYKLSMATDEAIDVLRTQAGIVYDPGLVQLFIDHIDELEETAVRESENAPALSFRSYFETWDRYPSDQPSNQSIHKDIPGEMVQLAEFCSTIAGNLDVRDILPAFCRRMERIVPFSTCALYLSDGGHGIVAAHASGKFSELLKGHSIEMGKGISGWVAAYMRPMINTGPALDFQGINGEFTSFTDALVVPIVCEDESLGTISLYAEKPISYGQYDLNILEILASLLAPMIAESKKQEASTSQDAVDPTTKIHRIPFLTAVGPQLISQAGKNRTPLSLIYMEIGNLIQISRVFGGPLANSILRRTADCIKPELRETDILVRYGYQGFVALLPGVRDEQAVRCIQRLKQQTRREFFSVGQGFSVDFKAGVSSYPKSGATVFSMIQSAQENMRSASREEVASDDNVIDFFPRP
jgi:diguanylate cyclase (GGDEF)-like protein/putative nucleotidyltransferase with HDIG domain